MSFHSILFTHLRPKYAEASIFAPEDPAKRSIQHTAQPVLGSRPLKPICPAHLCSDRLPMLLRTSEGARLWLGSSAA